MVGFFLFIVLWIYLQQHKEAQKQKNCSRKVCKAKLSGIMEISFIVIVTLHRSYSSVISLFFLYSVYTIQYNLLLFWGGNKTIKGKKL